MPEAEFSQDSQLEEDIKAGRLKFLKEEVLEASKQRYQGSLGTEIVFQVRESPDGGYSASAVGQSIIAQGDDWDDLIYMMRDAVLYHFDDEEAPQAIRVIGPSLSESTGF